MQTHDTYEVTKKVEIINYPFLIVEVTVSAQDFPLQSFKTPQDSSCAINSHAKKLNRSIVIEHYKENVFVK